MPTPMFVYIFPLFLIDRGVVLTYTRAYTEIEMSKFRVASMSKSRVSWCEVSSFFFFISKILKLMGNNRKEKSSSSSSSPSSVCSSFFIFAFYFAFGFTQETNTPTCHRRRRRHRLQHNRLWRCICFAFCRRPSAATHWWASEQIINKKNIYLTPHFDTFIHFPFSVGSLTSVK